MTTITDPPQEQFRLSMLLNDTRYRSYTFQAIALILVIVSVSYLASNLVRNLEAAGLNISFGFLGEPAGYDINQRPISYNNQDTHLRAATVGVLNTLIVAFLGCVTATILGVFAGVLRLSNNWLIARLMSIYVEAFRNVPVLIWILIIFFIMTAALPAPNAFRGTEPDQTMLFGAMAFTNRGVYAPGPVMGPGGGLVLAVFIASLIGVFAYRRYATKLLYDTGRDLPRGWPTAAILIVPSTIVWLAFALTAGSTQNTVLVPDGGGGQSLQEYVAAEGGATICMINGSASSVVTKTQLLRQQAASVSGPVDERVALRVRTNRVDDEAAAITAFEAGECTVLTLPASAAVEVDGADALTTTVRQGRPFEFDRPYLAGFNFSDGIQVRGSLIALWFALAIYTGAFIAENVRAGIQAIPRGQTEAAASLGIRPGRIMSLVILPQALRIIIPPVISQYLNLTKNSSLAIAVGYMDVTGTLGGITLNQTGRAIEAILLLMLFYLVISLSISAVMNAFNNAVKLKER
ncbi:MAG: ABC transporter permease subunit [Pseudomonadota bacterium]